jgi:hypothetical protein
MRLSVGRVELGRAYPAVKRKQAAGSVAAPVV